jgi:hypothetical protein
MAIALPANPEYLGVYLVSLSVWSIDLECDRDRTVKKYLKF